MGGFVDRNQQSLLQGEIEKEKLTKLAELFRKGARCIDHIVELLGIDDKEAMEDAWDQYILCMMKISEFSKP